MMQRMISRSFTGFFLGTLALAAAALPVACGGGEAAAPGPVAAAGPDIECGGKKRPAADCSSAGGASKGATELTVSDASSKQEETAITRINAELDGLLKEQAQLCERYNACAIDDKAYKTESAAIKSRIESLPALTSAMQSAKTYGARKRALDELYTTVVPISKRVEELTFRMGMQAELPPSAGGATIDVEPGAAVPTNARVSFSFEVSKDAHLYIFQKTPKDEVTVLFPDPRIGTENPLRAGSWIEIPPGGQRFRVNDKDMGDENVYIVVSQRPIESLDTALDKVKKGQITTIAQDSTLRAFTTISAGTAPAGCKTRALELDPGPGAAQPTCTRSRGLVLDGPAPSSGGAGAPSAAGGGGVTAGSTISSKGRTVMEVRTDPGDSVIVKVFPFKHVTEQDYPSAAKALKATATPGVRSRGVIMEY
jgi:hypothetical protein